MNSRLANTVGDRINQFDNLEWYEQTLETFNALFPECPIKDTGMVAWIEIGEVAPNNCRLIRLYEHEDKYETLTHKMYSDIMYTLDRDVYNWDERDLELDEINGVPV